MDPLLGNELFLLMMNLAQMKSRENIVEIFCESLSQRLPGLTFRFLPQEDESAQAPKSIPVQTPRRVFGAIAIDGSLEKYPEATQALIRNAIRMLGLVLENRFQSELLVSEAAGLKKLIEEKTSALRKANQSLRQEVLERKTADEAFRESETRYRELVTQAAEGIIVAQDGLIRYANPALEATLDYSVGEMADKPISMMVHPDDRDKVLKRHFDQLKGRETASIYTIKALTKKGRVKFLETKSALIQWAGRPAALGLMTDVSERMEAEKARLRLAAIVESSEDAIISRTLSGEITSWNKSAEGIFGYAAGEILGKHGSILVPQDQFDEWTNLLIQTQKGLRVPPFETVRQRKDGSLVDVQLSISPILGDEGETIGASIIARDITELKKARQEKTKLEAMLRQSQKMEAIGTLAGGIAHDFNNILGALLGYTELSLMGLPQEHPLYSNLEQILAAAVRAKNLVKQILTFSRRTEQELGPVEIEPILKETIKFLRSSLPSTIQMTWDLNVNNSVVLADPTQIHQVVMNLGTNAAQAMDPDGGILDIRLTELMLDPPLSSSLAGQGTSPFLCLAVSDTGHGMNRKTIDRIFEPYFTTKEASEGTGLGLAVVHGIVKNLNGDIKVYSEPGTGTVFRVFLPLAGEALIQHHPMAAASLPGGNERILFVDDEQTLVDLGRNLLERLGYQVTALTSSLEALRVFKENPKAFDLIITDQTMPGLTGLELAQEISEIRPELPLIICTGFSRTLSKEAAAKAGVRQILMKPLIIQDVAQAIRAVLDSTELATTM